MQLHNFLKNPCKTRNQALWKRIPLMRVKKPTYSGSFCLFSSSHDGKLGYWQVFISWLIRKHLEFSPCTYKARKRPIPSHLFHEFLQVLTSSIQATRTNYLFSLPRRDPRNPVDQKCSTMLPVTPIVSGRCSIVSAKWVCNVKEKL